MNHIDIGHKGEELAAVFLARKGYTILETNYRASHAEVDIIAQDKNGVLVFVEVKTRTNLAFGRPEAFVTETKQKLIAFAANRYMEHIGHDWEIRFDIVAIFLDTNRSVQVKHLKDAFFPGL